VIVKTFMDAVNCMPLPQRSDKPLRIPISGRFHIKGVGKVVTGRLEQGTLSEGMEITFASGVHKGTVKTIQTHHQFINIAGPGDIVGIAVSGLRGVETGDVLLGPSDCLRAVNTFTATVLVHDNVHLKIGSAPICFVRTGRASVRIMEIVSKKTKVGTTVEQPKDLTIHEMGVVVFKAMEFLVVDRFSSCVGLARAVFFNSVRGVDSSTCIMTGKITDIVLKN